MRRLIPSPFPLLPFLLSFPSNAQWKLSGLQKTSRLEEQCPSNSRLNTGRDPYSHPRDKAAGPKGGVCSSSYGIHEDFITVKELKTRSLPEFSAFLWSRLREHRERHGSFSLPSNFLLQKCRVGWNLAPDWAQLFGEWLCSCSVCDHRPRLQAGKQQVVVSGSLGTGDLSTSVGLVGGGRKSPEPSNTGPEQGDKGEALSRCRPRVIWPPRGPPPSPFIPSGPQHSAFSSFSRSAGSGLWELTRKLIKWRQKQVFASSLLKAGSNKVDSVAEANIPR